MIILLEKKQKRLSNLQTQFILKMSKNNKKVFQPCIIGLGYVGLPILLNLANKFQVYGYDINLQRINNLKKGIDTFNEYEKKDFKDKKIKFENKLKYLNNCNLFIITVPTPVFKNKYPDLSHLKDVCKKLSTVIKNNDVIIFESTVYPGIN